MTSGELDHEELAQTFAELSRTLLSEATVQRTLAKICELAVLSIPGCDHAGISFVRSDRITTEGATDHVPLRVDALQYETGQGPCLDAIREHKTFHTDDLAEERARWPQFAPRVTEETNVRAMLAFRLFVGEDTFGALNLYSRTPSAFDDDELRASGSIFAAHAAVALSGARMNERADQLEEALASRDVIGQAKGLLMARQNVTSDAAFDMLRRASQRLNIKLKTVAERMVAGDAGAEAAVDVNPA